LLLAKVLTAAKLNPVSSIRRRGLIVNKAVAVSLSALLGGMLAYLALNLLFPEIDTREFSSLIGLAAVIGALIGARLGGSKTPGNGA